MSAFAPRQVNFSVKNQKAVIASKLVEGQEWESKFLLIVMILSLGL